MSQPAPPYVGRFAPSPTGPLHAGSLVAALASWLDARAHRGRWLLRIEDLDPPREQPGAADAIIATLQRFGLRADGPVTWQSRRQGLYEAALARLVAAGLAYPCACTRREIADSQLRVDDGPLAGEAASPSAPRERVYPGTCRGGLPPGRSPRAWRLRVPAGIVRFDDRWCGPQAQDVAARVGDFVLRRADGLWAYQLAVVVDDADLGITDVVRGADLLGSTARQIVLQRALDLPTPRYLHVPVVATPEGEKLSKQTGALAVDADRSDQLDRALDEALAHLGIGAAGVSAVSQRQHETTGAAGIANRLEQATQAWRQRYVTQRT
jgi:glutamyl-Q tRNA(Asp) synthetase